MNFREREVLGDRKEIRQKIHRLEQRNKVLRDSKGLELGLVITKSKRERKKEFYTKKKKQEKSDFTTFKAMMLVDKKLKNFKEKLRKSLS